jgi:hypothetical protein
MRASTGRRLGLGGLVVSAVVAVGLLAPARVGLAQESEASRDEGGPRTWGSATTNLVVGAFNFQGNGSSNVQQNGFGSRLCVTGCPADLFTGVNLPNGALVTAVILDGCDFDPNENISFDLFRIGANEASQASTGSFATSGNAGCTFTTGTLPVPVTVNNASASYLLKVYLPASGIPGQLRFNSVRIRYSLQVSPTPLTASFTDVPLGHPTHRFVEALVASGLTAGCGDGKFCVGAPVTRGQLAVFLSLALGLHFPN